MFNNSPETVFQAKMIHAEIILKPSKFQISY